jgi:hypothetical protein
MLAHVAALRRHPEVFETVQAAIEELGRENRGADEIEARAMQAAELLAQGKAQSARETLAKAKAVRGGDWLAGFHLSLSQALLDAAQGNYTAARLALTAAMAEGKRAGCAVCLNELKAAFSGLENQRGRAGL